ncbi:MAG: MFS transporter [Candidatus Merdivicinus sp.]|jgi:MFS family permease
MKPDYRRLKYACYSTNLSMAVIGTLQPLLFVTFREIYGISYALLGTLVLINFCTQLGIDLIFSFYSHKFNIEKTVRAIPVVTVIGLFIYALYPILFPQTAYLGLAVGTVIFASSGGLAEVLISPVIAAIPAENPEGEMSKLHSIYAWGVVGVVLISTIFLRIFGGQNWQWLAFLWMLVPAVGAVLYHNQPLPEMQTPEKSGNVVSLIRKPAFFLCFLCIFLGGASECTMSQWSSSYLEKALGIPKIAGDIFGVAMFAVMLGLGRSLYAKYGRNIQWVLFAGTIGAAICYLAAAFSNIPVIGLAACALTGFCVSMLWPGSLLVAADQFPAAGVAIFALMAAGGDLGASVGPQMVGVVTDAVMQNESILSWAASMGLTADQIGMKAGLLLAAIFPLVGILVTGILRRQKKQE